MGKSLQLSKSELHALAKRAQSLQSRVKAASEKADAMVETGMRTAVVGGTAFAFGVSHGKWGGVEVVGMPLELLTGIGAHLAGFAGVGGKANHMLHYIGDGALASYLTTMGKGIGASWGKPGGATKGDVLSDAEMEKIAAGG